MAWPTQLEAVVVIVTDRTKKILSLNAFNPADAHGLEPQMQSLVSQRMRAFGPASVLFYDKPLALVRGEGCWLYDSDGAAYLDAYNNVPSVGHCHPRVVEAVARQLGQLNVHSRYLHPGIGRYSERLLATLPSTVSNIVFTCTGSESNDLALRLAANFTQAHGVIVTEAAYHGNTELVTQVSPSSYDAKSQPSHVRVVPPPGSLHGTPHEVSDRFANLVSAAIADLERCGVRTSALLVDSIFSSDGVYPHPRGVLRAAVETVHRAKGLLIADEVQCGFGRTGEALWGFERHGVQPDIVTFGKPMANGYPAGAVACRPDILEALCGSVGYFNTFAASPVTAAACQAVLDVIQEEGLMENAKSVGRHLERGLLDLSTRYHEIAEIRSVGLYCGVALNADKAFPASDLAAFIINGLRNHRVLIGAAGKYGDVLKIRPPLCFSKANAEQLVEALEDVLSKRPSSLNA